MLWLDLRSTDRVSCGKRRRIVGRFACRDMRLPHFSAPVDAYRPTVRTDAYCPSSGIATMNCAPLPDEPNALAALIAAGQLDSETKNEAFRRLIPVIERIARSVNREKPGTDIIEEAVAYIWDRLDPDSDYHGSKFDPSRGASFTSWCYTVLKNRACDKQRAAQNVAIESASDVPAAASEGGDVAILEVGSKQGTWKPVRQQRAKEELEARRAMLRAMLDRVADIVRERRRDLAVILFHVRWQTGVSIWHARGPDALIVRDVKLWIPWRERENGLRWKPYWPTIAEVWDEMVPLLQMDDTPTAVLMCHFISTKWVLSLSPGQWAQWLRRAKKIVEQSLPAEFRDLWNHFFPARRQQ